MQDLVMLASLPKSSLHGDRLPKLGGRRGRARSRVLALGLPHKTVKNLEKFPTAEENRRNGGARGGILISAARSLSLK